MGRGRCYCSPTYLLVSKLRILLPRVDWPGSVARGRGAKAIAAPGADSRLVRRHSFLLCNLLLAHLFDDPLRRRADGRRLPVTGSWRHCDRDLSRARDNAGSSCDQAMGPMGRTNRAGILDGVGMGAPRRDGPTLERTRLLASLSLGADPTSDLGWGLRSQLSDRRRQFS